MTRRRVNMLTPFGEPTAAEKVAQLVQRPEGRKRSRPTAKATMAKALVDAERRIAKGDWTNLTATSMMQLWAWCHVNTYGVEPSVPPQQWERGLMRVGTLCRNEFGGDYDPMLVYVRWAWAREARYEDHRRQSGQSRPPMGFHKLFGGTLLTDYRIDVARGLV